MGLATSKSASNDTMITKTYKYGDSCMYKCYDGYTKDDKIVINNLDDKKST
jgi:hypothetical protein